MQYLITAHDGPDMLEKRMEVRPRHLANMEKVKETGSVVCAGGILDGEGRPVGSALVLDFASKDLLDEYLEHEPYIVEKVWETVTVEPMHVVILRDETVGN